MKSWQEFAADEVLGYQGSRTQFQPGHGMPLDDAYCLAHLPLVAPQHPRVIPGRDGMAYAMGRHPTTYSAVIPISADALEASPGYRKLDEDLRAASFAHKVAWHILDQRRERLHATLCGGLGSEVPVIDPACRVALTRIGPIMAEVRGLFSGNVNRGRLYLRVYPEARARENLFHVVQRMLGRATTDLYLVGIWNLLDDLSAPEAAELAKLIEQWWSKVLLRVEVTELWLIGGRDNLVLDADILEAVPLVEG